MKTNALTRVRKYFPQVNKVVDATENVTVEVKKEDCAQGRRKQPESCALARACKRAGLADGAIINIAFSYLIKDDVATRYVTSETVGREITSFDRHHDFALGKDYLLSRVPKSSRLGCHKTLKGLKGGPRFTKKEPPTVHHHKTARIRVAKPA